jgi:hypothetical protein
MSLDALAEIGPFNEKLFIEHVDTDWSLRARAKDYRLYGLADARLDRTFTDPHAGDLYIFRGRRGDLVIPWHDGVGLSLYAKRLDRGKFIWPAASDGALSILAAWPISSMPSTPTACTSKAAGESGACRFFWRPSSSGRPSRSNIPASCSWTRPPLRSSIRDEGKPKPAICGRWHATIVRSAAPIRRTHPA